MFVNRLLCFSLMVTVTVLVTQKVYSFPDQLLEVHFIDVGQGDSIYIKTPENKHILIDGGPPEAGKDVVTYLTEQGAHSIDLLIATHPHYDHIGGLIEVIEQIPIKQIVHTGIMHPTKTYFLYMYQIWKQALPVYIPVADEFIFQEKNLTIQVLNSEQKHASINNASLAIKLNYKNINYLLLGDLEREAEDKLKQTTSLRADIVKIAHHGSKTSSSYEFLQEIHPKIAILTYGKDNKFGHPNERVVENINFLNTFIYSTASFGSVVITSNGEQFYIQSTSDPLKRALESN